MKVVAVRKYLSGTIELYKLSDGSIVNDIQAVNMVYQGHLSGYNVARAKNGKLSIRSNRDGIYSRNLANLPRF